MAPTAGVALLLSQALWPKGTHGHSEPPQFRNPSMKKSIKTKRRKGAVPSIHPLSPDLLRSCRLESLTVTFSCQKGFISGVQEF